MIYYFLTLIITVLISFFVFDLTHKKLFFSKKLSFFLISFVSLISIGVFFLYTHIGHPNYSEELVQSNKINSLKSKESLKNKILQTKENITFLEKKVLTKPDNTGLLLLLASNYAIIGNFDAEIKTLQKILEIQNNPTVKSLLAQALLKKNNGIISLLIKDLIIEVIEKTPNDEGANYIFGLYHEQIGDNEKANQIWTKLLINLRKDSPYFSLINKKLRKVSN